MAVQTRINPDTGILEYFDPSYGQDGQFVTIGRDDLDKYAGSFQGGIPENYAGFAPAPEGQRATIDPNTGIRVFTDIPPDPNAPYQPPTEEVQKGNILKSLDAEFIDPTTGQIKAEFAGGGLPSIEEIRGQDLATLQNTINALNTRKAGRLTGFKGEFSTLTGGPALDAFQGAVGTNVNTVDPYGNLTAIGRESQLATAPVAPTGTTLDLQTLTPQANEFLDATKYTISPTQGQITAQTGTVADIQAQPKTDAQSFTADKSFDAVKNEAMVAAKQQGLTDVVTAQTGTVEKEATVQGQLEGLMAQFEGGKVPAFAAGAIRLAEQRLAARGMGASSMAGAAIVQAAMEASTPIAAADAQTYRSMQELNLNNRQQAEVLNAQMTMQLDLANLNNEQQARVTNTSNRVQSLFRDQAAVNTAKQFNAANEQQNDQFFASLSNNTAQFKAAQTNAMERFNAGQENAVEQFNSTLQNTREQFNQKNSILIDQANAVYRRNINTANTAIQNAENEFNVRNLFNISQTARNNMLQEQRDQINFARVTSTNERSFKDQLALASFSFDNNLKLAKDIQKGSLKTKILGTVVDAVIS